MREGGRERGGRRTGRKRNWNRGTEGGGGGRNMVVHVQVYDYYITAMNSLHALLWAPQARTNSNCERTTKLPYMVKIQDLPRPVSLPRHL